MTEWLSLGPKMLLKGKINPTLKRGDTVAMERMVKTAGRHHEGPRDSGRLQLRLRLRPTAEASA